MTGIGLSEDLAKGIVDRFRSLPIARSAVLSGRILADSARTAASVLVTAAVGMPLGFRPGGGPAVGPVLRSIAWIAGLILVLAPLAIRRYRRLS